MYKTWVAMTMYKKCLLFFELAIIFHTILLRFSKLLTFFVETPFLKWRCPKGR